MAVPVFVADEVVTAAKMNTLPKGVLGYAAITANQTGITTEVDITGLSVTVDVTANRRIRISGKSLLSATSNIDRQTIIHIKESTTYLDNARVPHVTGGMDCFVVTVVNAPSAGSHTYKLACEATVGTATFGAAATRPAFILVEDLGAV